MKLFERKGISLKVSDYIVDFLITKGITEVFGYPGGSVTNLMDSFRKREPQIQAHVVYHEQAAAFAACAYAQISNKVGVAYATGGPGATNMLTAIGHSYYDSIPLMCLTGNVNTYEMHGDLPIRQRGFQESDIISVAKPLTKYCVVVNKPEEIRYCLEKAYTIAQTGRKGPVLIDLPMDILRAQVDGEQLQGYTASSEQTGQFDNISEFASLFKKLMLEAQAPCIVLGNGIKTSGLKSKAAEAINHLKVPYVTSMISFDVLEHGDYYYGFIGAYGIRSANFVVAKSDLIVAVASRLDIRQVGAVRKNFAPNARILRIDIDRGELEYKVHDDEYSFCVDAKEALEVMSNILLDKKYDRWLSICNIIHDKLKLMDDRIPNRYVDEISKLIPENTSITTDVGQNQVWVAQSFKIKKGQQVLFSGGMGAMGHALPAAIGAYYGGNKKNVAICICGDGGLQMNIQELQFIVRENIPIKIIVFNNYSLGMIRHFQEMYFSNFSYQTNLAGGYTTPNFVKVAEAYGIRGVVINDVSEVPLLSDLMINEEAVLVEIRIAEDTYVYPKLEYGKPNYDQQPLIDRKLLQELMDLK